MVMVMTYYTPDIYGTCTVLVGDYIMVMMMIRLIDSIHHSFMNNERILLRGRNRHAQAAAAPRQFFHSHNTVTSTYLKIIP